MKTRELADSLTKLHIDVPKQLSQTAQFLSTSGETGVMLWLGQREIATYAIDIVDHFGLTPGRVANIIKKLEERGYIARQQDAEDMRKSAIVLTERGREYAKEQYEALTDSHLALIQRIGEDDALEWLQLLTKVGSSLNHENKRS